MRKFSKINETKESILDSIGITEVEIKDIFQDVIDEYEYQLDIKSLYISKSGTISDTRRSIESYPSIRISLIRNIKEDDSKLGIKNWDGGIYYESNIQLLRDMHDCVSRLKSTVQSGDMSILYSIRSINDINIRIVNGLEKSDMSIDIEKLMEFIDNKLVGKELEDYRIEADWSQGKKKGIEIVPLDTKHHKSIETLSDDLPMDRIIGDILRSPRRFGVVNKDNGSQLKEIVEDITDQIIRNCQENGNNTNLRKTSSSDRDSIAIYNGDIRIITIMCELEKISDVNIQVYKGFFKNENEKLTIYKMDITIDVLI